MTHPDRIKRGMYWDEALSLVEGCTPCSPGCAHCWSAAQTHMRAGQENPKIRARYDGLTNTYTGCFNGKVRLMPVALKKLRRKKPTVFAAWNDLFHKDVPFDFIADVLHACWKTPRHTIIVLTKRPERIVAFGRSHINFPPNVILGTTVESQPHALRLNYLAEFKRTHPAVAVMASCEPLLAPVDLEPYLPRLNWVVLGGETGPGARPMHPDWARSVRDQCAAAGVPFFFKGWGDWGDCYELDFNPEDYNYESRSWEPRPGELRPTVYRVGKKRAGRALDSHTHDEFPEVTP